MLIGVLMAEIAHYFLCEYLQKVALGEQIEFELRLPLFGFKYGQLFNLSVRIFPPERVSVGKDGEGNVDGFVFLHEKCQS